MRNTEKNIFFLITTFQVGVSCSKLSGGVKHRNTIRLVFSMMTYQDILYRSSLIFANEK